ncbi:MAG: AraC family transcriptional regulator [Oscillospiraceae bacterium]|nr:AraC family transcriptional regulator [Oscillospiraceae bacterium]
MNPLAQMNEAMLYLEENMTGEISFGRMAQIAGCSEYHFRRMFSWLAGMPLGEYIRRRRLVLAATLLQQGNKVVDCALMCGYDSPDSFAKAFASMHGITPSQAKLQGAALKAFPPMTFQLTIKGGSTMEYRIVHKGTFKIVGFKKRVTLQFEGVNPQMESLTARLTPEIIAQLKGLCDTDPKGMLSVSANYDDGFAERPKEGMELDQYTGVATTRPAPEGYDALQVAESDWAVFTSVGPFPKAMQDDWARVYAEWLPSSDWQLTNGPSLVWYESPDLTRPDCKTEIWIPVEKKN